MRAPAESDWAIARSNALEQLAGKDLGDGVTAINIRLGDEVVRGKIRSDAARRGINTNKVTEPGYSIDFAPVLKDHLEWVSKGFRLGQVLDNDGLRDLEQEDLAVTPNSKRWTGYSHKYGSDPVLVEFDPERCWFQYDSTHQGKHWNAAIIDYATFLQHHFPDEYGKLYEFVKGDRTAFNEEWVPDDHDDEDLYTDEEWVKDSGGQPSKPHSDRNKAKASTKKEQSSTGSNRTEKPRAGELVPMHAQLGAASMDYEVEHVQAMRFHELLVKTGQASCAILHEVKAAVTSLRDRIEAGDPEAMRALGPMLVGSIGMANPGPIDIEPVPDGFVDDWPESKTILPEEDVLGFIATHAENQWDTDAFDIIRCFTDNPDKGWRVAPYFDGDTDKESPVFKRLKQRMYDLKKPIETHAEQHRTGVTVGSKPVTVAHDATNNTAIKRKLPTYKTRK